MTESETPKRRIVANKAECKLCGDIIESRTRHHFVECSCGEIFVDGGRSYLRRGFTSPENFLDLAEYEEINDVN